MEPGVHTIIPWQCEIRDVHTISPSYAMRPVSWAECGFDLNLLLVPLDKVERDSYIKDSINACLAAKVSQNYDI